jgi:hypothetical protein
LQDKKFMIRKKIMIKSKQMAYQDFDELEEEVKNSGNVLSIQMSTLRNLQGAGRLGPYVVEQISRELAKRGLGHYPEDLPEQQWEWVRIFKLGSNVADLIRASMNIGEKEDEKLRELASDDATDTLNRIRQLVC